MCSVLVIFVFCFNDTATTEIYTYLPTLSLHDALPIWILLSIGATLISAFPIIASAEGQQPPAVSAANAPLNAEIERLLREGGQRLPTGIEREELAAFYAGRNYAPLWVTQGHARPAPQRLIKGLKTPGQEKRKSLL